MSNEPDAVINALGLRCPLPIVRLGAAAKAMPTGASITLLADDPAAEPDVAAWCRMLGHELVDSAPPQFVVRLR